MITNSKIRSQQQTNSNSSGNGATGKNEDSGMRYGRSSGGDQRKLMNIVKPRVIKKSQDYDDNDDGFRYGSNESLNFTLRGQPGKIVLTGIMLPEDMRISKLLRRLAAESNTANAIDLCDKLKMVLGDPANQIYVRKSFDILADSILGILKSGGQDWLDNVAEVFGKMGYVIRADFSVYRNWIMRAFKSNLY